MKRAGPDGAGSCGEPNITEMAMHPQFSVHILQEDDGSKVELFFFMQSSHTRFLMPYISLRFESAYGESRCHRKAEWF